MSSHRLLLARIFLTLVTIGYSALTVKANFNQTHATSPLWTGHGLSPRVADHELCGLCPDRAVPRLVPRSLCRR
jgi:hypothetical protein